MGPRSWGLFVQGDGPCSHFPDDVIPAGAKSLFGGVFFLFLLLLLFSSLDPGSSPSHICFPNMLTQTARLANERGARYLNYMVAIETPE